MKKRIKLWVFLSILATGITVLTVAVFGHVIYRWVTNPYKETLAFYCYNDTMICENGNIYTNHGSVLWNVWEVSCRRDIYYFVGYAVGEVDDNNRGIEPVYCIYEGDYDGICMFVGHKPPNIRRLRPQEHFYRADFYFPEMSAEVVDSVLVYEKGKRQRILFDKETVNLLFEIYERDKSYEEPENAKVYRYISLQEFDVKGNPLFCDWHIIRADGQYYLRAKEQNDDAEYGYVYTYSKMDESEVHSIVNKVLDEGISIRHVTQRKLKNYFARLKKAEQQ